MAKEGEMTMDYFVNTMEDYLPGTEIRVEKGFWNIVIKKMVDSTLRNLLTTKRNPVGLYDGLAGIAFALYHLSQSDTMADWKNELLGFSKRYIDAALNIINDPAEKNQTHNFAFGSIGILATAALIYGVLGFDDQVQELIVKYKFYAQLLDVDMESLSSSCAGYVCGAQLINRFYKIYMIPRTDIRDICNSMVSITHEYAQSHSTTPPLMLTYRGNEELGTENGMSSILLMLMSCADLIKCDREANWMISDTMDFFACVARRDTGLPATLKEVLEPRLDVKTQMSWANGSPGMFYVFAKAYLIYKNTRYLEVCFDIGDLVWKYGLSRKSIGLRYGLASCGYVFLMLYRLTQQPMHLHRALKFAQFYVSDEYQQNMRATGQTNDYSLMQGYAGLACFLADLASPHQAKFPLFDLF